MLVELPPEALHLVGEIGALQGLNEHIRRAVERWVGSHVYVACRHAPGSVTGANLQTRVVELLSTLIQVDDARMLQLLAC
jgi:hypothetical protein